ncbi:TPA: hypothetical protein ACH3X3_010139 [Trebouxia sp. C0006]
MSPEADFIEWLRLRAPAADKITIANTSAQEGWLFAALLLAVSGSGRLGVSTPPVSLRTGSHNMLQSFRFCQLLAASLTEWCASDYAPAESLQLHGVRHLSILTKLTRLTLKDNAAVGILTELKHLRQL